MTLITIPWASWYGDKTHKLSFPDRWDVVTYAMKDASDIGGHGIQDALIKSKDLNDLLASRPRNKTVVICVDDLSRPTPTNRILPVLLENLKLAGFHRNQIIILVAVGAHRILTRSDIIRKLGKEIVRDYDIRNHSAFSNLVEIETQGEIVQINRTFLDAGLRIGVGCLMPHNEAGFSGGAKIVFPGLAGIDSIEAWHRKRSPLKDRSMSLTGVFQDNPMRLWMEQVVREAGLDLSINAVMTSKRGIAQLYVGDPVVVHRQASSLAKKVYATHLPDRPVDVAVFNAYPKDTEFNQIVNALHIINSSGSMITHGMGTIILTSAASEGRGHHYLFGIGMRLPGLYDPEKALYGRRLIIYSNKINQADVDSLISKEAEFSCRWSQVIARLKSLYGDSCRVAVFPSASLQIAD